MTPITTRLAEIEKRLKDRLAYPLPGEMRADSYLKFRDHAPGDIAWLLEKLAVLKVHIGELAGLIEHLGLPPLSAEGRTASMVIGNARQTLEQLK